MQDFFKRIADFFLAAAGILLLSPILLGIGILVRLKLGAPVLYTQLRPGRNGKPFRLVKFRTMTNARNDSGDLLPDRDRLTSFGKRLRSLSLDELPELWNILRADMSFVGPRPLLMEYLPLYSARQARRHEVRPGLTGWAQVNGRNAVDWDKRFELDVWYVDHRNLAFDLWIFLLTVWRVLCRDGISHAGDATMPRFRSSTPSGGIDG